MSDSSGILVVEAVTTARPRRFPNCRRQAPAAYTARINAACMSGRWAQKVISFGGQGLDKVRPALVRRRLNSAMENTWTPAHQAVVCDNLAFGADPQLPDPAGQTPMDLALHYDHDLAVKPLRRHISE
ncbi:hypothetical protein [Streptomyces humi]|uniref:hypothetical protein n=1 Tax=Streptomyces humi TaxID=1428620 RepID=UPI0011604476|nr:hypothetical protein [Streptomyces humi]